MPTIELDEGSEAVLISAVLIICVTVLLSAAMCTGYIEKPECETVEESDKDHQ